MSKTYKIIYIPKDGGEPEIKEIEGEDTTIGLEPLQTLVEGNIEYLPLSISPYSLDLYINGEGRFTHALNILIPLESGEGIFDLHGPVVVSKGDEDGNSIGLTNAECEALLPFFQHHRRMTEFGVRR
jgi:hypothetical protein